MIIHAPISIGELLDKLTILNIKIERIKDVDKLNNIINEQKELKAIADKLNAPIELPLLYDKLLSVNSGVGIPLDSYICNIRHLAVCNLITI